MNKFNLFETQCFFRHLQKNKGSDLNSHLTEKQKDFFESLIFYSGRIPEDVHHSIQKIIDQTHFVISQLIPLYQIGIRFDIAIAGGAIRDLLYGNHNSIKDIDLIVQIDDKSITDSLKNTPLLTLEAIIGKDLHEFTNWNNDSLMQKVHGIFRLCLNKQYNIERAITLEDIESKGKASEYDPILNKKLEGLITISRDDHQYPMDIILTTSNVDEYLDSFSFDICKAYIQFFEKNSSRFVTNCFNFLERIHVTSGFINDGMKKEITFDLSKQKSVEMIERTVKNHLPRVVKKYPNNKLVIKPGNNPEFVNWKTKYEDFINLNNALPINIGSPKNAQILKV